MGPIKWINFRGQATFEVLGALFVFVAFVPGFLIAIYLILARVFLSFAGEQALYCLAESRPTFECRRHLESRLRRNVPIGRLIAARFFVGPKAWSVHLQWGGPSYNITLERTLTLNQITNIRRVLPLSR